MKTTRSKIQFARLPTDYAGLCRIHLPRPIRDKADLENTTEVADGMAGHTLSKDQEDYFDLICRLIEDYEKEQGLNAPAVSGREALRHLLEQHGMNSVDLSRLLGVHRTLGAMILRGDRKLTLNHVRILARHFGVSADVFLD